MRRHAASFWLWVRAAPPGRLLFVVLLASDLGLASAAMAQPTLTPVPRPETDGLEDTVRIQLEEAEMATRRIAADTGQPPKARALAFGQMGQFYYVYDFFDAAQVCFLNAAQLDPGDYRWSYYRATLLQKTGALEEAAELYARVLARRPVDVASLVRLAEVDMELSRLDQAERGLRTVLAADPENPAAMARLGQLALSRGDHEGAVEWLENALQRVPEANRLHYLLAMAYRGLGKMEDAQRHLQLRGSVGVRVSDPLIDDLRDLREGERVYLLRGRQAFAAGDYAVAAKEFRKAVDAAPDSARAHVNLGSALGQLDQGAEAIAEYRTALELAPTSASAHFNLGVLLADKGDLDQALPHLERALALDPSDEPARLELGRHLRQVGRPREALAHFTEAARRNPASEDARLGTAATLVSLGRYREARDELEAALRLDPSAGRASHALARLLAACPDTALRDGPRALDLAQRVYAAQPTLDHAETVAQALAELGRCEEAAQWQKKVLASAEGAGLSSRLTTIREALERYRQRPSCRPGDDR